MSIVWGSFSVFDTHDHHRGRNYFVVNGESFHNRRRSVNCTSKVGQKTLPVVKLVEILQKIPKLLSCRKEKWFSPECSLRNRLLFGTWHPALNGISDSQQCLPCSMSLVTCSGRICFSQKGTILQAHHWIERLVRCRLDSCSPVRSLEIGVGQTHRHLRLMR